MLFSQCLVEFLKLLLFLRNICRQLLLRHLLHRFFRLRLDTCCLVLFSLFLITPLDYLVFLSLEHLQVALFFLPSLNSLLFPVSSPLGDLLKVVKDILVVLMIVFESLMSDKFMPVLHVDVPPELRIVKFPGQGNASPARWSLQLLQVDTHPAERRPFVNASQILEGRVGRPDGSWYHSLPFSEVQAWLIRRQVELCRVKVRLADCPVDGRAFFVFSFIKVFIIISRLDFILIKVLCILQNLQLLLICFHSFIILLEQLLILFSLLLFGCVLVQACQLLFLAEGSLRLLFGYAPSVGSQLLLGSIPEVDQRSHFVCQSDVQVVAPGSLTFIFFLTFDFNDQPTCQFTSGILKCLQFNAFTIKVKACCWGVKVCCEFDL